MVHQDPPGSPVSGASSGTDCVLCFFPSAASSSWLVTVLIAAAYLSILHLSGLGDGSGYYTRFLLDLLLVTAAFFCVSQVTWKTVPPAAYTFADCRHSGMCYAVDLSPDIERQLSTGLPI